MAGELLAVVKSNGVNQIADGSQPADGGGAAWTPSLNDALVAGAVLAATVVAYHSSIRSLINQWSRDDNFSYGFFVVPKVIE